MKIESETLEMLAEKLGKSLVEIHEILTAYVQLEATISMYALAVNTGVALIGIALWVKFTYSLSKDKDIDGESGFILCGIATVTLFIMWLALSCFFDGIAERIVTMKAPEAVAIEKMIKLTK